MTQYNLINAIILQFLIKKKAQEENQFIHRKEKAAK
jgi:hypothetical protein